MMQRMEGKANHSCTSTTTLFSTQESPGEICQAINSCGEYTEGVINDTWLSWFKHSHDNDLVIGALTKQTLWRLLEEGDISEHQQKNFYQAAREFLMCVTKYLPQWCPFEDELLSHVVWVGFENRVNTTSSSVEYVVNRFSSIFPTGSLDMNKLSEQFLAYQVLVE